VSLYLDLDPSAAPTTGDIQVRVSSLLGEAERRLEHSRARLDHAGRAALLADLERIGRWFRTDFDRGGVRGLAVFADGLDNFWRTLEIGEPVVDDVKIGDELYLAPLTAVAGTAPS